jgi:alpha-tubulin suppressor-like RCC1 family protein
MIITKDNGNDLWDFGMSNSYGQLCTGFGSYVGRPVKVFPQNNVFSFTKISCQIGLLADGTAWTWGTGYYGSLGNNESFVPKSSPISVVGNHSFIQVQSNTGDAMCLKADGTLWGWGYNYYGVLGNNASASGGSRSSPVSVVGNHSFIQYEMGNNSSTIALKSDGTAWNWGQDYAGALGINGTFNTGKSSPVSVLGNHSFIRVMSGGQVHAGLKADGSAWMWGGYVSTSGHLGDNTIIQRSSPVSVVGNHSFIKITHAYYNTAALKTDGTCWCWGNAGYGALGDNQSSFNRSSPVSVVGNHSFIDIRALDTSVSTSFIAFKADGSCWGWGSDNNSCLGGGGPGTGAYFGNSKSSPCLVVGNHSFSVIQQGTTWSDNTYCLKNDGSVWGWGAGGGVGYFYLGVDYSDSLGSPVKVISNQKFTKIYCGYYDSTLCNNLGLKEDGSAWYWGYMRSGNNDGLSRGNSSPVSVVGNHSFIELRPVSGGGGGGAWMKKADGTYWGFGDNSVGMFGDGTSTSRSSPVTIVGNHSFVKLDASKWVFSSSFGLKADGSCWGWGYNYYGNLGDNTTTTRYSPVAVVGNHSFIQVLQAYSTTFGLKADGTCWSWGDYGSMGILGDNINAFNRSSPISVVGNHSFIKVFCELGYQTIHAMKADGTIWGWGRNNPASGGAIGDNTTIDRSSPVSVVGNHSFVKFDGCYGYKTDGSIWAWGNGSSGNLGDNTNTSRSSPVKVAGNYSWASVRSARNGNGGVTFGRTVDGSVYIWGTTAGSVATGINAIWSSPTLISSLPSFWNQREIIGNNNTGSIGLGR